MQSEPKLRKILETNEPWFVRWSNTYLKRPLLYDLLLGFLLIGINYLIVKNYGGLISYTQNAIGDILNELISSTLASGGFVLAALAILASIKQSVSILKGENPKNGKEFFYNSKGYKNVINIYGASCIIFLLLFLLFTFLRGSINFFSLPIIANLLFLGIVILTAAFSRCIILLWLLIKI